MSIYSNNKAFSQKHTSGTPSDHYESVTGRVPRRSKFNLSHSLKTSFNAGRLVPILCKEVLPGDTFNVSIEELCRLSTPINPTMDTIHLEYDAFFVPNRVALDNIVNNAAGGAPAPQLNLGQNHWKVFMGEQMGGLSNPTTAYVQYEAPTRLPFFQGQPNPTDTPSKVNRGSLLDLLYGIPSHHTFHPSISQPFHQIHSLKWFGYIDIWNHWYRDQNTQNFLNKFYTMNYTTDPAYSPLNPVVTVYGDFSENNSPITPDTMRVNGKPFVLCKKHDYFTSCLPLSWRPISGHLEDYRLPIWLRNEAYPINNFAQTMSTLGRSIAGSAPPATTINLASQPVNIAQAIRTIMALNVYSETEARFGTLYDQSIFAHFGLSVSEYRLDYPEFLGSYNTTIGMCQVPQTSSSDNESPQGNLAAFGMSNKKGFLFNKTFTEHGHVFIMVSARIRQSYQNGIERENFRGSTRLDYYSPEFRHLTMQPISRNEIYSVGSNDNTDGTIFGWQDSWQDYRAWPNRITGQMRSLAPNEVGTSLDEWHYAENFTDGNVYYNYAFIMDNSERLINRTLAVDSSIEDQFKLDIRFIIEAYREIPHDGTPKYADHI